MFIFFQSLLGKNNLALMGVTPKGTAMFAGAQYTQDFLVGEVRRDGIVSAGKGLANKRPRATSKISFSVLVFMALYTKFVTSQKVRV